MSEKTTLNLGNIDLGSMRPVQEGANGTKAHDIRDEALAQKARANGSFALKENPDEHAKNLRMSQETGLPVDAVKADPVGVETELKLKNIDFGGMTKRSPNTAEFLTDYDNSVLAQDDVSLLQSFEEKMGKWGNRFSGVAQTAANLGGSTVEFYGKVNAGLEVELLDLLDREEPLHKAMSKLKYSLGINTSVSLGSKEELEAKGYQNVYTFGPLNDVAIGLELNAPPSDQLTGEQFMDVGKFVRELDTGYVPDETIDKFMEDPSADKFAGALLEQGPQALVHMANMGLSPAAYFGGMTETFARERVENDGRTMDQATLSDYAVAGLTQAIVQSIDRIGLTKLLKKPPTVGGVVTPREVGKKAVQGLVVEGGTEGVQGGIEAFGTTVGTEKGASLQDIVHNAVAEALLGGPVGAGVSTAGNTVRYFRQRKVHEEVKQEAEQKFIDDMKDFSSESKMRERSPERFKQFIEKNDGENNTHVYIDGAQLKMYLQQPEVAQQIESDPALQILQERVDEAVELGTDVSVPVGDFATHIAPSDHFESLRDLMVMDPETTAPFRKEQADQQAQDYMQSLVTRAQESVTEYTEAQEIFDQVQEQLVDSGVYSPENAAKMAQVVPAWATVYARENGISVAEAYQRSGLVIEGPQTGRMDALAEEEQMQQRPDPATSVDPAAAATERLEAGAQELGLTEEQVAQLGARGDQAAQLDPMTGLFTDRELVPAVERATRTGGTVYTEADMFNLGGVNNALGSNEKANAVISEVAAAYQRAFGENPVFRRKGARFGAIVPEGFDVDAAMTQVQQDVAEISQKYGLDEVPAARYPGEQGIRMNYGSAPVSEGDTIDSVFSEAQSQIKGQLPQEEGNVDRDEAAAAWIESSAGQPDRVAARVAQEVRREPGATGEELQRAARALEPQRSVTQQTPRGEVTDPEASRAAEYEQVAEEIGLTEEARERFRPQTPRDNLTGWFTNEDRVTAFEQINEIVAETGADATYVSIDIGNLGGLNDILGEQVADIVFKNMAQIALGSAQGIDGVDVVPFRHGGDEVSLMVLGADPGQMTQVMKEAEREVQRYVNAIGIQDLPHAKYIGQPERYGSGIYTGVSRIDGTTGYEEVFDTADMKVEARKAQGPVDVGDETMPLRKPVETSADYTLSQAAIDNSFEQVDAAEFSKRIREAKNAHDKGAAVHEYSEEEYRNMKLFLADEGKVGFAVKPDGDLVSVFKHPDSDYQKAIQQIVPLSVQAGARKLDAFEGYLTREYAKAGFVEVDRQPWNEEFRPEGWTEDMGKPDVVFMEYRGPQEEAVKLHQRATNKNVLDGAPTSANIPNVGRVELGIHQPAVEAAKRYMESAGLPYVPLTEYVRVDPEFAKRIADEFEKMEHRPNDPEVKAAYDQMIQETLAQYEEVLKTGLQVEFINFERDGDPYANSPYEATLDVVNNNHLWVFSTRDGFGSNEEFDPVDNPLLQETQYKISGQTALANDIFRVVHDYFGHVKNGVGFRANGEENAWQSHASMYTKLARRAMTVETRGQNSWLNFGPYGETNRTAKVEDTVFADQKIGLLPEWASEENRLSADILKQRIQMVSAVEKAVAEMNLPQWKKDKNKVKQLRARQDEIIKERAANNREGDDSDATQERDQQLGEKLTEVQKKIAEAEKGGTARGQDVWNKLKSTGGVKEEELFWLGIEEFLTADPDAPFTREMVTNYIAENGVVVEEVEASVDPDAVEGGEFDWNEEVMDDPAEWEHRVEYFMDEYDRADEINELEDLGFVDVDEFRDELWENVDRIVTSDFIYTFTPPAKRAARLRELVKQEEDLTKKVENEKQRDFVAEEEGTDFQEQLDAVNDEVEKLMMPFMRDHFQELAERAAEEEYMDNPIRRWTDNDTGIEIIGNDDVGYQLSGASSDPIYSFNEAEIQAEEMARDQGLWASEDSPEMARWEEYVTDGAYDNYRELKLTLPEIEGDFYNDVHFPDRNVVAFLRVTDRELQGPGVKQTEYSYKVEKNTLGRDVVRLYRDGTVVQERPAHEDPEKSEMMGQSMVQNVERGGVRTFFVDELQSDWHQDGRQSGYREGLPADEVAEMQQELDDYEDTVLKDLRFDVTDAYYRAVNPKGVSATEAQKIQGEIAQKYGYEDEQGFIYFDSGLQINGALNSAGGHPNKNYMESVKRFVDDHGGPELKQRLDDHIAKIPELKKKARTVSAEQSHRSVPNAPFKNDGWIQLSLKRALQIAAQDGHTQLAWPNSRVLMDRWSDRYKKLYETQYDTKMTSMVKKLTKQKPQLMNLETEEPLQTGEQLKKEVGDKLAKGETPTLPSGLKLQQQEDGTIELRRLYSTDPVEVYKDAAEALETLDFESMNGVKQGYWVIEITPELRERILNNGFTLFQDQGNNVDQSRGYYQPSNSMIRMTEAANLSTFLHEFAHFAYEMELKSANQEKVKAIHDWFKRNADSIAAEATEYAGAGTPDFTQEPITITSSDVKMYINMGGTGDGTKDGFIREATHEQFARGFEAYLAEGKAPSIELRNVFATFARWLAEVYRAVRGRLRVNLDDPMREVFDRMLATEEQIETARARNQYEPMFNEAAMAGMTDKEFEEYKQQQEKVRNKESQTLREKLINQLRRQTKRWWKQEKQDFVDEQREVLKDQPVYRATETLRGETMKLDHAAVIEMFGEEVTDKRGRESTRIPPKLRGMTITGARGVHPDQAAAFFGFSSGAEMVEVISNTPTLKEQAEINAEKLMKQKHGDILNDGSIEQQADEALANEERGELLLQELRALARQSNTPTLDRQSIKSLAEENISKLSYRQIQPGKYRKAEIRAAQEAATMLAEGNTEGAMHAKARQVMNYYLNMAATNARNETLRIVDRMGRYNRKSVKEAILKAEGGYWEQLEKLLKRFEFRKSASLKQVDQVNQDINTWMQEKIEQEGDGLVLSAAVLDETYVTHWKNVPFDDLKGIADSVKNIEHVARYANKLTRMGEEIEFKKLVSNWVDKMNQQKSRFTSQRTDVVKGRNWGRWAMGQMTKIPWMARWLDGGEEVGLSHQILVQPFTDAADAEIKLWGQVGNNVMKLIENRDKATVRRHNRKIYIPEIKDNNNDGNLYGHQVLSVALNVGNEGNLRKLLLGEGWADPDNEDSISINNPKLQAVLKHMTREDWQMVQTIWDRMDELYPQLADVHRRTTGLVPPKVEATPVDTPHGQFRGGYYPVKYDANRSHKAAMNEERLNAQVDSMFGSIGSLQASVNASAVNERTKYYAPIRLSLDVVPGHFQEVIHYITHHDAVREVNKLIRHPEVADTIKAKLGPEEYAQLKPWLNDIAKDGREAPTKVFWDSMLKRLRFGTTLGVMGFKASTGLIQISGLSNTVAEVGIKPVYQSMRSILGSVEKMKSAWAFAKENSKVLEHRTQTMDREIKNAMNRINKATGTATGRRLQDALNTWDNQSWLKAAQEMSMKHIALIQTYMVDLPSWYAAYIKSMDQHGDEQRAYQYADWVVENVQGSGMTKDLPQIMRSQNEANRMFTMFMTFFSSLWNMERDLVKGARSGRYSTTNVAAKVAFLFVIPVVFEMLLRGELGGDDDDEESKLQEIMVKTALYPAQSVPFIRDIVNATVTDYGYNMSPVAQLLEQGTRSVPELGVRALTDEEITKGQVKGSTRFLGAAGGVPGVSQMWATGEHLYQVLEQGEEVTAREFLFGPNRE